MYYITKLNYLSYNVVGSFVTAQVYLSAPLIRCSWFSRGLTDGEMTLPDGMEVGVSFGRSTVISLQSEPHRSLD